MKRFLQAPSISGSQFVSSTVKKLKQTDPLRQDPRCIISWNCNGMIPKMKDNGWWKKFSNFITEKHPDVICFQEVKLSAWGPLGSKKGDNRPRDHGRLRCDNKMSIEECQIVEEALRTYPFDQYIALWSLAEWKYAGTLMLVKKDLEIKALRFNLDLSKNPRIHNNEGRVIAVEFDSFILLATYTPNNGVTTTSFSRRQKWDDQCLRFVENIAKIVTSRSSTTRSRNSGIPLTSLNNLSCKDLGNLVKTESKSGTETNVNYSQKENGNNERSETRGSQSTSAFSTDVTNIEINNDLPPSERRYISSTSTTLQDHEALWSTMINSLKKDDATLTSTLEKKSVVTLKTPLPIDLECPSALSLQANSSSSSQNCMNGGLQEKSATPLLPSCSNVCGYPPLLCPTKPLIWIGDLNCAYEDVDLSDPQWFRKQDCRKDKAEKIPPEYCGQPGCTNAERERFRHFLEKGQLTDAYRYFNPTTSSPSINGAYYTWRGTAGIEQPQFGRYYGKGMRIDHSLVHCSLLSQIERADICGWGVNKENFFNSDHSPILLQLR